MAEEIERRYPKILRRVGGYNLDEFIKKQPFNLARMVIGSEGTLATVVEAKLKIIPLPQAKVLGIGSIRRFDCVYEGRRADFRDGASRSRADR